MRSGRVEDLPKLVELWRREVIEEGRQDIVPDEQRMRRMLARFDWDTKSRVVEDGGSLAGAVLVMSRPSPEGVLANIYAAGRGMTYGEMVSWGVRFSRAAGASIVQVMVAKNRGDGLQEAGLVRVRPWWRMDRRLHDGMPQAASVGGYELLDARAVPTSVWEDLFNRTFADHWRHVPRAGEEVIAGKTRDLCLMAVTAAEHSPAAITLGEVERYEDDLRPQPVGLVSAVGTLPAHRRRGLAGWLVADVLHRLQAAGARCASLYVDGLSPMRAYDVYRKLGFEVTFEAEVWEAVFS